MDAALETATLAEELEVAYNLVPDPDGKVVKEYGVYNLHGDGVATPSIFIIGPERSLQWSYVGKDIGDRPSADDILSQVKDALALYPALY